MKLLKTIALITVILSSISFISLAQVYTDEVQVVEGLDGKVGIGTPNPGAKLAIESPDGPVLSLSAPNTTLIYGDHSLTLQAKSQSTFVPYIEWRTSTGTRQAYLGWQNSYFNFSLDNGHALGIMGGNVGIGTATPATKLDVNGSIQVSSQPQYGPVRYESYGLINQGTNGGGDIYIEPMPGRTFYVVPFDWSNNLTSVFYGKVQIGAGMTFAGTGSNHINLPQDGLSLLYGSGSGTSFIKTPGAGNYTITHEINSTGYHLSQNASSRDIRIISYSGGVQLAPGATSWTAVSDIRLKKNIRPITNSLSNLLSWRAITYNLKSDEEPDPVQRVGVVAQDIQKTRPEAVSQDDEGYLGVRYTELIPDIIVAIQEMKQDYDEKLEELYALVKAQKQTIEALEKENNQLKSEMK